MTTVLKMLELSTGHVSKETAAKLDESECPGVSSYPKGEYGWWVYAESYGKEEAGNDAPPDLVDCLRFAQSIGCDWIMFDRDVDQLENLVTYDW